MDTVGGGTVKDLGLVQRLRSRMWRKLTEKSEVFHPSR